MRKTSIIIVTYNNLNYTKECIQSILKYTQKNTYEIIVIDNNSKDNTKSWLKKQKNLKIILNNKNLGFPVACNQGIKIANKENDILLLNNDTIVTTNWLSNLKKCLYSNDKIGATGSVCNHDENLQGVNFSYSNFEEMQKKAKENNISDPNKWEQKNFLIGFCLLIKREVINKIHFLDEAYSPGYVDDNDLCMEIIKCGYQLMLCHDSFIHHYLGSEFRKDLDSFYNILEKNRAYFKNKWKFETILFDKIKYASLSLINKQKENFKLLEFDGGIGSTLLKLKYMYPNIIIDEVSNNENEYSIIKNFTTTYYSNFEFLNENIPTEYYDYILIGNLLEQINNVEQFIRNIKKYLKEGGYIIGEIHNASFYKNIKKLLNNESFNNFKNNFTFQDINLLFQNQNFKNGNEIHWIENINDTFFNNFPNTKIHYYAFIFQK